MDGQTERRIKDFLEKIPSGVKVVAATKCRAIELVSECPAHGIFAAGENRVQELLSKYQPVEGLEWHFIGQLQTNKVKYILDKVSLIQSLDRVSLADKLEEECAKRGLTMPVLVEVKHGEELTRDGVSPDGLMAFAEYVRGKKHLTLNGLMTVMPLGSEKSAFLYKKTYKLFEKLRENFGSDIKWLSMGMSVDYLTAIENGSNMIRPGRALFGERFYAT